MPPELVNPVMHWLAGMPCFRIYARSWREKAWRVAAVYAVHRRNTDSRWPLLRDSCTTWAADLIAVGWDFAAEVLAEQRAEPASRQRPVRVVGGTLSDLAKRQAAGGTVLPSCSEIMAHECGHTLQALRMGPIYLPLVGSVTLFREGPHPRNRFENEASAQGLFGGIVNGSVCAALMGRPGRYHADQ
jgi:hypothetical protein